MPKPVVAFCVFVVPSFYNDGADKKHDQLIAVLDTNVFMPSADIFRSVQSNVAGLNYAMLSTERRLCFSLLTKFNSDIADVTFGRHVVYIKCETQKVVPVAQALHSVFSGAFVQFEFSILNVRPIVVKRTGPNVYIDCTARLEYAISTSLPTLFLEQHRTFIQESS